MKRLLAALVAVVFALSFMTMPIAADSKPRFFVDTYNANVGDEVVVPVMLANYEGNAHILNMSVNYDPAVLAVSSVDRGEFLNKAQNAMVIVDYTTISGSIRIGVACATNPVEAGSNPMSIVLIHFTVLEAAGERISPIELVVSEFMNFPVGGESSQIDHSVVSGQIIIGASTTEVPTNTATSTPTVIPTETPEIVPTTVPTEYPAVTPTAVPTEYPTVIPTEPSTSAVPESAPCFFVDTYYASVGDEIVVPVVLYNYQGNAHVLNMQVNYDTNALAITQIYNGEFLTNTQDAMVIVDHTSIPGSIRIGVACATDPIPAGSNPIAIINVGFRVLEGARNADNDIELVISEFKHFPIGGNSENIEYRVVNGRIVVDSSTPATAIPEPTTQVPVQPTDTPEPTTQVPVQPTDTPEPITDTPTPYVGEITLTAPTVHGEPGETITVQVTIEGDFQVHSMQVRLMYDPEFLTFESVQIGDIFGGNTVLCDNQIDEQGASVRLGVFTAMSPINTEGTVFTVTFEINQGADNGASTPLTFDREHLEFDYIPINGEGYSYPVICHDGEVIIDAGSIITDEPTTDVPVTNEPTTEEPVTNEPNVTNSPISSDIPNEATPAPTDRPTSPATGTTTLFGIGAAVIISGIGTLLFRKKVD